MDILTLQSVLDTAATMLATHRCNMMDEWTDEDLAIEAGMERVIRMVKDTLNAELEARDNDAQWIDYVVQSAIENNTFDGHYISWDSAYDEAAEELDVDHDTLCDAFDRVKDARYEVA
jgi:predicted DNA-binding protein YlxM (UPF0122 family)